MWSQGLERGKSSAQNFFRKYILLSFSLWASAYESRKSSYIDVCLFQIVSLFGMSICSNHEYDNNLHILWTIEETFTSSCTVSPKSFGLILDSILHLPSILQSRTFRHHLLICRLELLNELLSKSMPHQHLKQVEQVKCCYCNISYTCPRTLPAKCLRKVQVLGWGSSHLIQYSTSKALLGMYAFTRISIQ